ncbi:isochorismatase family protein [Streptomyces sp. NPDC050617]|uniref:cysteine hydrolase family protein n=1 Tax=Streptomyces sp. NPDC050617 TaxID=3154628 RepID=UPI0034264CB2
MTSTIPALTPGRTALLLMDLQPSLLHPLPEPDRLLENAQRAQRAALAAGIREIHVRVAFTDDDRAAVPAHNKVFAPVAGAGGLAAADRDNDIHPLLREGREGHEGHEGSEGRGGSGGRRERGECEGRGSTGVHTVTKTRVGAFSTTSLDAFLREQGIDTLVLAGIVTSGVVLSTVREAADRDYRLFVLADACDDPDPQLHRTLMESVLPTQADVIDIAAFEEAARRVAAR